MPEKTAEEHTADGWFITGDVATIAEDGRISIVGRAKDLIIAGGYNIYPREIELLIDAVPGVAESAVIGVPHPDLGEAVVAVVTTQPGAALSEESVRDAIAPSLARSEEHTSELQSLMRISYAVFCLKKKKKRNTHTVDLN